MAFYRCFLFILLASSGTIFSIKKLNLTIKVPVSELDVKSLHDALKSFDIEQVKIQVEDLKEHEKIGQVETPYFFLLDLAMQQPDVVKEHAEEFVAIFNYLVEMGVRLDVKKAMSKNKTWSLTTYFEYVESVVSEKDQEVVDVLSKIKTHFQVDRACPIQAEKFGIKALCIMC